MGLDMYAFTMIGRPAQLVDFDYLLKQEELHYWRKHPNLHGWMQALYQRKGGGDPDFNLAPVVIERADLDELEAAVRNNALPETVGFFFGESDSSEQEHDLTFIAKARAAIVAGKTVFYVGWW